MKNNKNLLEKLGECYKILTNKQLEESISVNEEELHDEEHRKKMFSLERELSDLMDTGTSEINSEDERKYVGIHYVFQIDSNSIKSPKNAYALVRQSYVENDSKFIGSFMNARIPIAIVPEKMGGNKFDESYAEISWYISKDTIRVFGFTHETFKELFYRSGYYLYLRNVEVVNKDASVKLGTETISVEMRINDSLERNYPKKNYIYSQRRKEERAKEEEQERRAYLELKNKFEKT